MIHIDSVTLPKGKLNQEEVGMINQTYSLDLDASGKISLKKQPNSGFVDVPGKPRQMISPLRDDDTKFDYFVASQEEFTKLMELRKQKNNDVAFIVSHEAVPYFYDFSLIGKDVHELVGKGLVQPKGTLSKWRVGYVDHLKFIGTKRDKVIFQHKNSTTISCVNMMTDSVELEENSCYIVVIDNQGNLYDVIYNTTTKERMSDKPAFP